MYISNHDKRILKMLVEERNRLQSSPKSYHKAAEIDVLTKHIVAIRNTIEYASVTCEDSSFFEAAEQFVESKPIVLKRGQSISLRMC